jgi:hypothetical protein
MKDSKFTAVTDIGIVVLSFIIFIHAALEVKDSVILKTKFFKVFLDIEEITPIMKISSARNKCDEGYETFFNFTFPPTQKGPYSISKGDIDEHCTAKSDCIDIPKINNTISSVWRNKVLCLKRMSIKKEDIDSTYRVVGEKQTCPSGFRQCALHNIQFKDILCIENGKECPINSIQIIDMVGLGPLAINEIELSNSKKLVFSNQETTSALPITFQVGEAFPCVEIERISNKSGLDSIYYPFFEYHNSLGCNRSVYREPKNFTDDGLDDRYEPLDSIRLSEFLIDSDYLDKYLQLKPIPGKWENNVAQNITFYQRGYVAVNSTCVQSHFKDKVEELRKSKDLQMIYCLVNLMIVCGFISMLGIIKIAKRHMHVLLYLLKILLGMGFITYNVIISLDSINMTNDMKSEMDRVIEEGCIDLIARNAIYRYELFYTLGDIVYLNRFLYWFCFGYGSLIVLQFMRFIYKVVLRCKNRGRSNIARQELDKAKRKKTLPETQTENYKKMEDSAEP